MRDSLGHVAPITIRAFDVHGTSTDAQSAAVLHHGHDEGGAAHRRHADRGLKSGSTVLVGQVGNLQTAAVTVPVTFLPFQMQHLGVDTTLVAPLGDSTQTGVATLSLRVSSVEDSASAGIVVRYALIQAPASSPNHGPAVIIQDNSGHVATADTTSASGTSSRRLVVTSAFLADPALAAGTKTDTAIVEARASYKGAELKGSPVTFVIPIRVALK